MAPPAERDPLLADHHSINPLEDHVWNEPHGKTFFQRIAGYLSLMMMMAGWICEGEFEQILTACPDPEWKVNNTGVDHQALCYPNNFFITYCTRIGWAAVLVGWLLWRSCILGDDADTFNTGRGNGAFSWSYYLKWSTFLGVGIFASSYTWYISLGETSFGGNAAVYQTAPVFVFILSVMMLGETVTVFKCFAVLLSVAGCAVLSLENSQGGKDSAIGYVWEIGSVILYAVYEVFYKKYCCDDSDTFPTANSQRFFGTTGVMSLLVLWPLFFAFDKTGYEKFEWPTSDQVYYIVIVAACDTIFNLFLVVTILLTSPLFTSVGTILVIPIGCLVDYLWKDTELAPKAYYGVVMIIFGFAMMVYSEHKEHQAKEKEAENKVIYKADAV
mmetsp:Transcript_78/g.175  ORF Transcript_78/g.175 Transcript_78/m.175 type:complete len:386 (-) Transcript_78:70-1227(-)